jgi:hypothetical protein
MFAANDVRWSLLCLAVLTSSSGASAENLSWRFQDDFQVYPELTNPVPDAHGHGTVWHFLRTTTREGFVGERRWIRDGRYAPLREWQNQRFFHPRDGWTFKRDPPQPPAVGRNREPQDGELVLDTGDVLLEPGPEAAVVVGWRSPVAGVAEIHGGFEHLDGGGDGRGQVRWYVERGPEPDVEGGFEPHSLASGHARFGTASQRGAFELREQVAPGDFVYFMVDAIADGTLLPHECDGTRFDVTITVTDAVRSVPPDFERDVQPILAARCYGCHGDENPKAGLDLQSVESIIRGGESGPAIVAGHPDRSVLVDQVFRDAMPPADHEKLTSGEKEVLWQWVRLVSQPDHPVAGVRENEPEHWAFQVPVRRSLPFVTETERVRNAIDTFVLARLESKQLSFSPDAVPVAMVRRATLDVTGLPPTPREVRAFVNDRRPDAYERLVDRLLASPHYGERWARHWLDVAGYVDTAGDEGVLDFFNMNEGIWRYRDYVVRSLNANKPHDVFLTEQLAGDELVEWKTASEMTPEILDSLVATGYLRSVQDETDALQYGLEERYKVLYRVMESVSTGLLGLTFQCARCHDHKYEPVTQRDYYRLMACFETAYNVKNHWLRRPRRVLSDRPHVEQQALDQFNDGVNTAAQVLKDERTRINQDDAFEGERKKQLIDDLTVKIEAIEAKKKPYNKVQALWDVGPAPVSHVFRGGQWNQPGVRVEPGFPAVLSASTTEKLTRAPEIPGDSSGRRLALARWLTRANHPLTARVLVNRVWHHNFGRGIVATPGNFGRSGSPASHPELLDWLARDFIDSGWNVKRLHRQILTSTTYRQSSKSPEVASRAMTVDRENSLLWRANLKRLDSEIVRDAVLATSDVLDRTFGGEPVPLTIPASGLTTVKNEPTPSSHLRRSLYVLARRNYPLSLLETFDSPTIPVNCTERKPTATVQQSLTFLNSAFVMDGAARLARLVLSETEGGIEDRVEAAYWRVLARPPLESESEKCCQFLRDQAMMYRNSGTEDDPLHSALVDFCHMLLCSNEFLYVE